MLTLRGVLCSVAIITLGACSKAAPSEGVGTATPLGAASAPSATTGEKGEMFTKAILPATEVASILGRPAMEGPTCETKYGVTFCFYGNHALIVRYLQADAAVFAAERKDLEKVLKNTVSVTGLGDQAFYSRSKTGPVVQWNYGVLKGDRFIHVVTGKAEALPEDDARVRTLTEKITAKL